MIPDSVEKGNPGDNLILYGFGGANDTVGSLSPYVGKVETYLRMNDIPYEAVELKTGVGKSPKKLVRIYICSECKCYESNFVGYRFVTIFTMKDVAVDVLHPGS